MWIDKHTKLLPIAIIVENKAFKRIKLAFWTRSKKPCLREIEGTVTVHDGTVLSMLGSRVSGSDINAATIRKMINLLFILYVSKTGTIRSVTAEPIMFAMMFALAREVGGSQAFTIVSVERRRKG